MRAAAKWIIPVLLAAACGAAGYWYGIRHPSAADSGAADASGDTTKPTVAVRVLPIRHGTLHATVSAFGPVLAQPSDVTVMSVPFESRAGHILMTPGQQIAAGAVIGELSPSPDTQLQLRQAEAAIAAAKKDFANSTQRFNDHLATNSDLLTSQQNLDAAQLKLDSFTRNGASGTQKLKAPVNGIVSKIDVQEGQIVPAGGPLLEIVAGNRIAARLGLEPSDAAQVHPGDPVTLTEVRAGLSAAVDGKIELITKQIDHDTGLVDVLVTFPKDAGLLLGGFVRGEFATSSADGLIVPRAAALPTDDGYRVFTIEDGHAVEHAVKLGLQNDQETIVDGDGLKPDSLVVISGNYELENQMAVTLQEPNNTQPATTTAATTSPSYPAETRP